MLWAYPIFVAKFDDRRLSNDGDLVLKKWKKYY